MLRNRHHISITRLLQPHLRFKSSVIQTKSDDEEQDDFFTDIPINDRLDAIVNYDDYKEDRRIDKDDSIHTDETEPPI